jgi:hypothetical protein
MLARFADMEYAFFGEATVQMLPDLCSNNFGLSVQISRILHHHKNLTQNKNGRPP